MDNKLAAVLRYFHARHWVKEELQLFSVLASIVGTQSDDDWKDLKRLMLRSVSLIAQPPPFTLPNILSPHLLQE